MPPSADCIADSAGGLTFDVSDHGAPDPAHLVLVNRSGGEEVRLPLTPRGDGRLRASLPISVGLPEGRWDVYVQVAGDEPVRLMPGVNDLRSLVDRASGGSRGYVAVRIPYVTKHGNLTVRSWLRTPHAEAGELQITDGELTVHGRLLGTAFTAKAHAEIRSRAAAGPVLRGELTVDGVAFTLRIGYDELSEGPWDLWLRPAGEDGPEVRVARLLDDIADKKPIFAYPVARVSVPGRGELSAGPYYTLDNDLSVQVTSV
ncbi:hypothetical protein G3I40_39970 [Streptomyces sp. SID14478]|uniref:hypothetical protein n=1 Tax=Streptomyces sp. SID14478 TaxID=2706073 RepID=UPI0013E054F4|nr:hypothetical protein [Streptomyces sp. SID14478]NEB81344.1 hypothetical protein [Streptomyces sp. SID14478]